MHSPRAALVRGLHLRGNHARNALAEALGGKGVEHFLPLYESVRRWSDRKVRLQRPLFPGYVFVRIAIQERLRVERVQGGSAVGRLQRSTHCFARHDEIDILRRALTTQISAAPHPFLAAGTPRTDVRGAAGRLVRRDSPQKRKRMAAFVLSIELIQRSVIVDLDTPQTWSQFVNHEFEALVLTRKLNDFGFQTDTLRREFDKVAACSPATRFGTSRVTLRLVVVAIFSIPILIRDLGTDRFGVLALAWAIVGYASLFDLGLGRALTQLVAQKLGADPARRNPRFGLDFVDSNDCAGHRRRSFSRGRYVAMVLESGILHVPVWLQTETDADPFYLLESFGSSLSSVRRGFEDF